MTPMIVDGDAVLQGGELVLRTDRNGYVVLDLYRTGTYGVLIQGFETDLRSIIVPDAPSVNLVHLLFPVVSSVTFSPDPLNINVDDVIDVDVTVLATNGQTLDINDGDVLFTSSDTSVVSIEVLNSKLRVVGVGAGTAEITAVRADESIVILPDEPTTYAPLAVTVS